MPFSSLTSCLALCNSTWHSSEIDYAHIFNGAISFSGCVAAQIQHIHTQCYQAVRILFFYHFLHCFELGKDDVYFEIAL